MRLDELAREQFFSLDSGVREAVAKKLKQLEREDLKSRHLAHGSEEYVEEVGQYRIIFKLVKESKLKRVGFIGKHKEYEKWCKGALL